MPIFKVNIKWQKEKYSGIECDTDESPEVFKALIFSLTGIIPERQKIMMPGGSLKSTWSGIRLKDGITIMVMGTMETINTAKQQQEMEKPQFIEDMTETQINRAMKLPQGLTNIGNTCYMNATIQCLRSIPELSNAIELCQTRANPMDLQQNFVYLLGNLFKAMKVADSPLTPLLVLKALHQICPQFASTQQLPAEQGGGSILMQQDANECWTEIMRCLGKSLQVKAVGTAGSVPESFVGEGEWNFVEQFLTGRLEVCTVNTESGEREESAVTEEPFLQLSCFIDKDVKYLQTGIRNGLNGSLTKYSELLARDALFKRSSKISRLPAYLSMQFVRFYYKEKEKINAKVLKDVKFSLELDMYDFCSEPLQRRLLPMREKNKIVEDRKATAERERRVAGAPVAVEEAAKCDYYETWFSDDRGSNNSGLYELKAVLTHQGRSSNSGHYLGWVRYKGDVWVKYDDDSVTEVSSDDILRLSGGGDWHCAYLLIYGPKLIEREASNNINSGLVENEPMELETNR